ncbi:hypothetical protein JB92DRAFT_2882940 [Gautieria morchelliformis]|nr:hypothetical protein JB92DRAFT_2882940 [Gautieria morchelliformis]
MCRRVAEGIRFRGCGHFTRMFVPAIVDCSSSHCQKSIKHPASCKSCRRGHCLDVSYPLKLF